MTFGFCSRSSKWISYWNSEYCHFTVISVQTEVSHKSLHRQSKLSLTLLLDRSICILKIGIIDKRQATVTSYLYLLKIFNALLDNCSVVFRALRGFICQLGCLKQVISLSIVWIDSMRPKFDVWNGPNNIQNLSTMQPFWTENNYQSIYCTTDYFRWLCSFKLRFRKLDLVVLRLYSAI